MFSSLIQPRFDTYGFGVGQTEKSQTTPVHGRPKKRRTYWAAVARPTFHLDFRGFQAMSEEQRQKSHTLHIRSNDIICIVTSDVQTHLEIRALRVFMFLYFSDGSDETIKS